MRQLLRFNKVIKVIVISGDLILLNAIFIPLYYRLGRQLFESEFTDSLLQILVLLNLCYLVCALPSNLILYHRVVRPEKIVWRAISNGSVHAFVFITLLTFGNYGTLPARFFIAFYTLLIIALIAYRISFRKVVKFYRKCGGNSRTVVLIGADSNMMELHKEMTSDIATGFRVVGYFNDVASDCLPETLPYLGPPSQAIEYLKQRHVERIYCSTSATYEKEILPIISHCENHLIHFFYIPNLHTYLKKQMHLELLGNTPVLCIRKEPLSLFGNRVEKRAFDVIFSILFLCTLFPIIYLLVGITIKITSPGPILFRQQRSGEDGRIFWCYKFRSMKVNTQSDILQATKDDPRKSKFGNFLRRTSIDELPQFLNVLRGEMSIVGPRPHMLKHTEQYSQLINKYMVRHFVKPGITGWSQISGYRGETRELWQMEGRVQRDIWYIEHWTFMLDIYIIYKTIFNAIKGEKEAY